MTAVLLVLLALPQRQRAGRQLAARGTQKLFLFLVLTNISSSGYKGPADILSYTYGRRCSDSAYLDGSDRRGGIKIRGEEFANRMYLLTPPPKKRPANRREKQMWSSPLALARQADRKRLASAVNQPASVSFNSVIIYIGGKGKYPSDALNIMIFLQIFRCFKSSKCTVAKPRSALQMP